ncbi:hypothetical protein [Flexivirga caeni]|uniref:hypothetical protein n=1 Tax=Flexivirga caeni TaxID=2294115 RepID=UPI001FE35281|nr:hypothetical protein [Flexivirga caeni]
MTRTVVLLEGVSDIAAVQSVARARELDLADVRLVDLGGITNVQRELRELQRATADFDILGLCDAPEVRFVERALHAVGRPARDESDLAAYGFFVCRVDLEDELIRALGTDRVIEVIARLGLATKLATLRQQPAWQDRPLADQLHRFCGVASGRKELLAGALAEALDPERVPAPLAALIDRIARR